MNFNLDTARMSRSNPPVHPQEYPVVIPAGFFFDPDVKEPHIFNKSSAYSRSYKITHMPLQ
ncbi:MAG TPA: hypothetical protein DCX95_00355 [Elusimicrobia bacterium]|nr:hypothetical protein [Elusimicrobiota bacterium]